MQGALNGLEIVLDCKPDPCLPDAPRRGLTSELFGLCFRTNFPLGYKLQKITPGRRHDDSSGNP